VANFDTVNDLLARLEESLADNTRQFFSLDEELAALNEGMYQLYMIVHAENAGFFFNSTPETLTLQPNQNFYTLTNPFAAIDMIRPTNDDDKFKTFYKMSRKDTAFRMLFQMPTTDVSGTPSEFYFDVVDDRTLVVAPTPLSAFDAEVYRIGEPTDMIAGTGTPPVKRFFCPAIVEYAARKLKGKEETGEYASHESLYKFIVENVSKHTQKRADTNVEYVDAYDGD